jgi:4-hydroxybenzoate polyprenyltransferase
VGSGPGLTAALDPERPAVASRVALVARIVGVARLVHPFPSVLDGLVVGFVALVGGGGPGAAAVIGLSMTLLQFAIGTLNDIVDAPRDAGHKPGKPIPAGLVALPAARAIAIASAASGVTLALTGGPALVVLALVVLSIGAWYDLKAKGTSSSWLPLAVGIPLLPVYGWFGATGELPGVFLVIIPAAANAGTALAIANASVDMERDEAAGFGSIALALGEVRSALLVLALHAVVAVLAFATASVLGAPSGWVAAVAIAAVVPLGGGVLGLVSALGQGTNWRELAWEIQAVGTGLLAVGWLGALSAASGVPGGT